MTDEPVLLDTMLGKLATYLRMCGYDAAYAPERGVEADDAVMALAREEGRRLLTRDAEMAARMDESILLTAMDIADQLREVEAAGLPLSVDEPTRCSTCNGKLEPVKSGVEPPDWVPDPGAEPVWQCEDCGQYFWKGSHWKDVASRLEDG